MTRKEILDGAEQCVCHNRENQYGSPEDSFSAIADLWSAYLGEKISARDVGILMALMKIARIRTGAFKDDSYIDCAGYIACAGEIASQELLTKEEAMLILKEKGIAADDLTDGDAREIVADYYAATDEVI